MKSGSLKERRKKKALRLFSSRHSAPCLTTTESLCAIDAGCGAVKFHRLLEKRGLATPVNKPFKKGYDFYLLPEYGSGTYSMDHFSFQWKPDGIMFMSKILEEEGIPFSLPEELLRWVK